MIKQLFSKLHHLRRGVQSEDGSQLIEYIAVVPMLLTAALIGWQFLMAGHTFVVTANGAREGARALAVCRGTAGDATAAVNDAVAGVFQPQTNASRGRSAVVEVTTKIPVIDIFRNFDERLPPVRFRAVMRAEKCR